MARIIGPGGSTHYSWTLRHLGCAAFALGTLLLLAAAADAQPRPKDALQEARQAIAQGEFERAFDIARQVQDSLPPNSPMERRAGPVALSIMASALAARGRAVEAEALLRRAGDSLAARLGDSAGPVMRIRADDGTLLRRMGRIAEAREVLGRVPLTGDEEGATRHGLRARLQLADLLRLVGDRQGAKTMIEQVLATAGADPALDGPRAGAAAMLARVLSEEGAIAEAYELARRSLAVRERQYGAQGMLTVVTRAQAGSLALRLERLDDAEPLLSTALADAEKVFGSNSDYFAAIAQDLADLRERQRQFDQAAVLHRRAVAAAHSSGSDLQAANADRRAAQYFLRRSQPDQAVAHFRGAITRLERIFSGARSLDEGSRQGLTDRFSGLYTDLLSVLASLHAANPSGGHDREALAVSSQAQSRIFTDLMRQADVRRFSSDPRFLDGKERLEQTRQRLAQLRESNALAGLDGGEADIPQAAAAELQAAKAQAKAAEDHMWRDFPRFMELVQPRPVTVDDLQQRLLRPGEALLSTATLPDITLVFAVTRDSFRMVAVPMGRKEVDALVLGLRSAIETASEGTREAFAAFDPAQSHTLSRALVAPVEPLLAGASQVLVVADRSLQTLPFEMLVTQWGEAEKKAFQAARAAGPFLAEYATIPWLANRYRFAYLPSLAALASERLYARAQGNAAGLVSFADPVFAPAGSSTTLPRLPETADEARAIARVLGGDARLYLRAEASEHAVKNTRLDKTRYLHFATHGLLSGEFLSLGGEDAAAPHPQPALALTMVGELNGQDGLLTMREVIEELKLDSDLVVLSACNTAGEPGRAGTGEGFAGLTRAFMFAGAHGLVVSHWSVESISAQELITTTFSRIAEGDRPLAALEAARQALRGQTAPGSRPFVPAHPFFWAPFVYVGS